MPNYPARIIRINDGIGHWLADGDGVWALMQTHPLTFQRSRPSPAMMAAYSWIFVTHDEDLLWMDPEGYDVLRRYCPPLCEPAALEEYFRGAMAYGCKIDTLTILPDHGDDWCYYRQ